MHLTAIPLRSIAASDPDVIFYDGILKKYIEKIG